MNPGLTGLMDFVGYSVWAEHAPPDRGKGPKVGGQNFVWAMIVEMEARRHQNHQASIVATRLLMEKIEERYGEYEKQRRLMLNFISDTILLAEV